MQLRNTKTGKPTMVARAGGVGAGIALVLSPACAPAETAERPPQVVRQSLTFPGTITLGTTCPEWSPAARGRAEVYQAAGQTSLLAVIDARLSDPAECDPAVDWGAGPQEGASTEAPNTDLLSGDAYQTRAGADFIKDGVVVKILGYAEGQHACHATGQNDTTRWYKVQASEGDPAGWVAQTLLSPQYLPSSEQLQSAGIPNDPSQARYQGTSQGGC